MSDVGKSLGHQFLPRITGDGANRVIEAQPSAIQIDMCNAYGSIGKRCAVALLALTLRFAICHVFRDVPEITDHAGTALGQGNAIDLPLIEFELPAATTILDLLGNNERLSAFQRSAESLHHF